MDSEKVHAGSGSTSSTRSSNAIGAGRPAIGAGAALIVWIKVQVQWITFSVLHGICLVWGGLIIVVALLPSAREYCRSKR